MMQGDADDGESGRRCRSTARGRARERGISLSRVANEYLRAGLRSSREAVTGTAYEPPVFDTGRPLVDVTDVAAALESLDRAD
jgi:hypothetical protein